MLANMIVIRKKVVARVRVIDKVVGVEFDVVDIDVILRSCCTLGSLVGLNKTLDEFHKDTVKGITFRPMVG